jgi:hypothetical protein
MLRDCTLLAGKDYQAVGDLGIDQTSNAVLTLHLGHPQAGLNMRGTELLKAVFYGGRYYNIGGRAPRSSEANPSGDNAFDLNGAFAMHALVNWQDYGRDSLKREARSGLLNSLLGYEFVSPGLALACWRDNTDAFPSVPGATPSDHTLAVWRMPVQAYLADFEQTLPPDIFTWDLVDTSNSIAIESKGVVLQPGDHILALSPWIAMRLTSTDAEVTPNLVLAQDTIDTAQQRIWVDIYNWQSGAFDEVAAGRDVITGGRMRSAVRGPYISPSGDIRYRIRVREDTATLTSVGSTVSVRP